MPGSQKIFNTCPMQSGKIVEIVTHPLWQKQLSITRNLVSFNIYLRDVEGICKTAAELKFAWSEGASYCAFDCAFASCGAYPLLA